MKRVRGALHEDYLRSLMFGLQDGIVSTTGVVVGISTGVSDKAIIVLAAIVAVMVLIVILAAISIFGNNIYPYIPGSGQNPGGTGGIIKEFLTDSRIFGSVLLIIVGSAVAWIITKKAK